MFVLRKLCLIQALFILLTLQSPTLAAPCYYHFSSRVVKMGNFSSPQFPNSYPPGLNCHYTFEGEDFEGVKIAFFIFDLEPPYKTGCLNDYVDISTINIHNVKHLVGRYCGRYVLSPFLSMHSKVEIVFRTNYALHRKGFHGAYEFIDEQYVPPPTSTALLEGCGGLLSGPGGVITSPGYPTHFPGNVDCLWLIRVTYSKHVYIRVLDLQLHGSIARLAIYDGYNSFSHNPAPIKSYCGDLKYYKNVDDRNALSPRNRLIVRFSASEASIHSDEVVGFKIVWTEVALETKKMCADFACVNSQYCIENQSSYCKPKKLFCIDKSLQCNKLPNCSEGDTSDEEYCNSTYMYGLAVGAGAGIFCLLFFVCLWRRLSIRGSLSRNQNTAMQLRQLEHSPSCSTRQLASSFSQPCDLLSPTVNGLNSASYEVIFTGGGTCPRHSHRNPTDV